VTKTHTKPTHTHHNTKAPKAPKPQRVASVTPREIDLSDPAVAELFAMHTYCRPAGSDTEAAFCKRFIDCIPGVTIDAKGNRIVTIHNEDGSRPRVLWSSHTDTVHAKPGRQKLAYGAGMLSLGTSSMDSSSCLGADCTAGVWLMCQMIDRLVPGLYIFHAAEEIGGIGSSHIAIKTPELLDGIDYAIAMDRRGTTSVITHQGARCASTKFAEALAAQLSTSQHTFQLDSGGTFTDTANYTDLVPECTNISVGYYSAHSSAEYLDVPFLLHLLERLCQIDLTTLPVVRVPGDDGYDYSRFGHYPTTPSRRAYSTMTLEDLVYDHPNAAARILEELGITSDDFEQYIYSVN